MHQYTWVDNEGDLTRWYVHFNSDWSGSIRITHARAEGEGATGDEVDVALPFDLIMCVVGEFLKRSAIEKLEALSAEKMFIAALSGEVPST